MKNSLPRTIVLSATMSLVALGAGACTSDSDDPVDDVETPVEDGVDDVEEGVDDIGDDVEDGVDEMEEDVDGDG